MQYYILENCSLLFPLLDLEQKERYGHTSDTTQESKTKFLFSKDAIGLPLTEQKNKRKGGLPLLVLARIRGKDEYTDNFCPELFI